MISGPWWWPAVVWGAGVLLLAIGFWPWTTRLCRAWPDRGAGLAIPFALFGSFLVLRTLWLLFGFQPHSVWCLTGCLLTGGIGWALHPPFLASAGTAARMRSAALRSAALFFLLFAFWVRIRAADPGIEHTEQPMDFMWMKAASVSAGPHILDAWFGNSPATYYTDGYQFLAFLSLLLGQPISIGVNLAQATVFAMTGLLAAEAARRWTGRRSAGRLATLLILFVSTPLGSSDALRGEGQHWWWWRATRVLKDGDWDLITEFPFFSFWLGDNHPHVIGLPFLLLAVVAALQIRRARNLDASLLFPAGLAIAWAWRINPWQVPTAMALLGLGLLSRKRIPRLREAGFALGGCLLGLIPLMASQAGGLFQGISHEVSGSTTPLEFLLVFGCLVPGLLFCLRPGRDWMRWGTLLLGLGMFLVCERFRVEDVFQNRMNTVFKVYYQLWILIGLLAAMGWAHALNSRTLLFRLAARISLIVPVLGLAYAARLSGTAFAADSLSLDARSRLPEEVRQVVETADRLIRPGERIAEAPGDSFQPLHSLLGTWTPGGSIIGWSGHQAQWRPGVPQPDPRRLYTAPTESDLVMTQWDLKVDWVLLGPREQSLYTPSPEWTEWMDQHFNRVIDQPGWSLWGPKGHEYLHIP